MEIDISNLPQEPALLQELVIEIYSKFGDQTRHLENTIKFLYEQINQLKNALYGQKSEKFASILWNGPQQKLLFAEADAPVCKEPENEEIVVVGSYAYKKKRGPKPLPECLPRKEIIYDIPEEEKMCDCGCEMIRIGQETSEQLEMQPAQFWVTRHIRYKYACKKCEGADSFASPVKIAPVPVKLIPKSFATPSLLAHLIVSKFCDALPFFRQEKQFVRHGIALSRGTMCNWSINVADKLTDLARLIRLHILSGPIINIDETPFQVLKETGRSAGAKSYMWVMRGGPPGQIAFHFQYSETRCGSIASKFLEGYAGIVQTDGYCGYNFLANTKNITHIGCWAHVRRNFTDVIKASNNDSIGNKTKPSIAEEAVQTIRKLYAMESNFSANGLSAEAIYLERQQKSKPIVDEFCKWLKDKAVLVPPKSLLGKALTYALNQWPRLVNYLDNGIMTMDNNLAENAIRPFVVGRKNWLFFEQPDGARAGATLYSFIETAKANELEPYHYLLYIFDKLPHIAGEDDLKALLPWNIKPEMLALHKNQYFERGGVV